MNSKKPVFAVIGGGRWGRVLLSVIAKMELAIRSTVIVSQRNQQPIAELCRTLQPFDCQIVSSLDALFSEYKVQAALVVNAANAHFDTAMQLLEHNIPILIEKPVVLFSRQAQQLVLKAQEKNICFVPGLTYRFCSYLHRFAYLLSQCHQLPQNLCIEWSDARGETRYGETKHYDKQINVAQDVMPHIWTILWILFPHATFAFHSCSVPKEDSAHFSGKIDQVPCQIVLERDALKRKRKVTISYLRDALSSLDFSTEPGIISLQNQCGDPEWENKPRPLARQLSYFISQIDRGEFCDTDAKLCLDSVSFCEKASNLYVDAANICLMA